MLALLFLTILLGFMIRIYLVMEWSTEDEIPTKSEAKKILFIPFYWWYFYFKQLLDTLE